MSEVKPVLSEGEERFERFRKRFGLVVAPVICVVVWWLPIPGLSVEAHRLLAVLGLVVALWISEAIPMPVTALLGPALCVVSGVGGARGVLQSFANPVIFLFLGSFMLAEAMLHHGLNRRIAFRVLGMRGVGESSLGLLCAFGGIAAVLSMWASNTATTAMMMPIGVSILTVIARRASERAGREVKFTELPFGTGLMLLAAFGASVGGMATPVGTPPNLIGRQLIEERLGVGISFVQWMMFGVPLAAGMVVFLVIYFWKVCPAGEGMLDGSAEWIRRQRAELGPWSRGEINVVIAFGLTVTLWVVPGIIGLAGGTDRAVVQWLDAHLPEAVVAILGASLLFVLPTNFRRSEFTLTWKEAKRIDWGTILLFGGGIALGDLMVTTGLATWLGEGLSGGLKVDTTFGLVVLFTLVAVSVSEMTSNTASATMVVPVAMAVSEAAGVNPLQPALAATLGASMGFMLPVSTPPNAIVYGTGCVPLLRMVKYGVVLDVFGSALIIGVVMWLV